MASVQSARRPRVATGSACVALREIRPGWRGRWCAGLQVRGYTAGQRRGPDAVAPFGVPHPGRAYRQTRPAGSSGGRNQKECRFVTMTNPSGTNAGRMTRRKALKLGAAASRTPVGAYPHRPRRRQGLDRFLGPLGAGRQRHHAESRSRPSRAKNQVEVQADFITSVGSKNLLTIAAEAQAKTGHDIQAFPTWEVQNNADVAGADGRRDGSG